MRFLLDVGFPAGTLEAIRGAGMTVTSGEEAHLGEDIVALLDFARRERMIVVTPSAEVARVLDESKEKLPSIIEIRNEAGSAEEIATQVRNVAMTNDEHLERGVVITSTVRQKR